MPPLCSCLPFSSTFKVLPILVYGLIGRKFLGWETLVKSEEAFSKNTDDYSIFLTDSDEFGLVSIAFQTGSKNKSKKIRP